MSSDEGWARALLRCPACGATLQERTRPSDDPVLVCEGPDTHAFPVRDGIPVLLLGEMLTDQTDGKE